MRALRSELAAASPDDTAPVPTQHFEHPELPKPQGHSALEASNKGRRAVARPSLPFCEALAFHGAKVLLAACQHKAITNTTSRSAVLATSSTSGTLVNKNSPSCAASDREYSRATANVSLIHGGT
jgi:hypothetical protein